nr:MAG TPA: hypothetical protein [Caudoviricetes sp.]
MTAHNVRNSRHMGQAFIHFLSIQEKSGYRFHDNRLISFGGTCGGRTCDSLLKRLPIPSTLQYDLLRFRRCYKR